MALRPAEPKQATQDNPLMKPFNTPFQVPPFDEIKLEHFLPAIEAGIKANQAEIDAIVNNPATPDFKNTILAYDTAGDQLSVASRIFSNLNGANTNPAMQKLARQITPLLTRHRDNISLNPKLFQRIKAVYEKRNSMGLDAQQIRVTEKYYKDFERNGANLSPEKQARLREINEELSKNVLQFGENLLAETNKNFRLVIDKQEDLAGLPADVIEGAAIEAAKDSLKGKWVFTLAKPSMLPFLSYANNRALREKLYRGYFMRGDYDNKFDNKELIRKMVLLRDERAKLLGFKNFASYVIDENMAKTPEAVYQFLHKLWVPSLAKAKQERAEFQSVIDQEGGKFKLQSWDWWYYAEKVRKAKYNLEESELKPYFSLDHVQKGMFYVANKLYGITFEKRTDLPVYHPEVVAYEVKDKDQSHLAVLYMDFHPRDGKRVGAWCTGFAGRQYRDGKKTDPIISMVMNFTRPTGDAPALLTFEEVTTAFHEFGHALHSVFADGPYERTARDVPRDFVELPSQVDENWAAEPQVLKAYAKHYKTGEVIPDALIEKMEKSSEFNQGFITTELLAASILDMDYNTAANPDIKDVRAFEKKSMQKIGLIDEILPRYRSTYFQHSFSGGYTAGYYVYLWAAVLDADAFDAFKSSGDIFNPVLAAKFRDLLTHCGTDDGMVVYRKFRGKDPDIKPLLKKRGLL
ncbi:MAG: M3 family metallopeptidase [Marinilabiliales bacterium]|nr:M3 family metallopeptidase [Marinilabiliales bacterium]